MPLPTAFARFSFSRARSDVYGAVDRPIARVWIRSKRGSWLPHAMLVDSGADFSLVPKLIGELLGFEKTSSDRLFRVGAVGGWVWVVMRRVQMRIGGRRFDADVGWAQAEYAPLILGRADVFDRFDVTISQRDRTTELRWRGA